MFKLTWKSWLASPALLGIALATASVANAAEVSTKADMSQATSGNFEVAQLQTANQNSDKLINQVENYSSEGTSASADQVTSVSELRDVQPTEWAYEALRSLVERYGCIVGYPDRTFRGNRALTRWEFAAGLNACLNTMERLIQENVAVLKEDIDKLKRLVQEYEAELAALGARVDNLEGRVAFLEDHQFSTTTKLTGEVIFAPSWAFNGDFNDNQAVFQDRVRLRFNTSFTGDDLLVTRLSAGNGQQFTYNLPSFVDPNGNVVDPNVNIAAPTTLQTWQNTQTNNNVNVDWLAYYAPISLGESARLDTYIAAWGGLWDDFVPTLNPYFEDNDGGQGSLSTFSQRNPIYRIGGGGGAGISYRLGFLDSIIGSSSLNVGYLSGTANDPNQGFGLFNGNYGALAQLNGNLFNFVNFGFTYVNAYSKSSSPIFGSGALGSPTDISGIGMGLVGTEAANLGGALGSTFAPNGKSTNSYGLQAAIKPADWISLSAFGSYTSARLIGVGDADIWTYGAGVAFPDLFKQGNVLGIFAGVQPYLGIGNTPVVNGVAIPGYFSTKNPISVEAYYKYQVTDNISVTPGIQWVTNPSQTTGISDALIGTIRGTFTF